MRLVSVLLILCFGCNAHAQVISDSIIKKYASAHDSVKVKEYLNVAAAIQNKDYANCTRICDEVISLAHKNHDLRNEAEAELLKGLSSYFHGSYAQTLRYYLSAKNHFEQCGYVSGKAKVCNELGIFYMKQKNNAEADNQFKEAYAISQQQNLPDIMASSLNNQGLLAQDQGKHAVAIGFFTQAKSIYEKIKDSIGVSYTLDYASASWASSGNYEMAIQYQNKALGMRQKMRDSNAMALSLVNLAEFESLQNHTAQAEKNLRDCLEITESIKFKDLTAYCYKLLAQIYIKKGDAASAYQYQLKYNNLNEEIFNEKSSRQINELQTQYETEGKKKQIQLLTAENRLKENQKATQRNLFLVLIALSCLAFLAFYHYSKRKKQKETDAAIIQQKEERTKAIIEAEEKERIRIARDLHDGVAQTMVAAKMQLEAFLEQSGDAEKQNPTLQNAFSLIQNASTEVRAVSHSMIPNALLKSGLVVAVRDFVNLMGNEKLKINLQVLGLNNRMTEGIENVIFRVLQELVNNIVKHANANEITIQLIRDQNEFTLIVEDNGVGFDVKTMQDKEGVGLKNISARVSYLHGNIYFDAAIGRGTTVIVEIPL